jgi:hypothetical protein
LGAIRAKIDPTSDVDKTPKEYGLGLIKRKKSMYIVIKI